LVTSGHYGFSIPPGETGIHVIANDAEKQWKGDGEIMPEILAINLFESKMCARCGKIIEAGENAIRVSYHPTKKSIGVSKYFHPGCWSK
jgi:hypothetical protein